MVNISTRSDLLESILWPWGSSPLRWVFHSFSSVTHKKPRTWLLWPVIVLSSQWSILHTASIPGVIEKTSCRVSHPMDSTTNEATVGSFDIISNPSAQWMTRKHSISFSRPTHLKIDCAVWTWPWHGGYRDPYHAWFLQNIPNMFSIDDSTN